MGLLGDIEHVGGDIVHGVEDVAGDIESLVSKAGSELESLGVAMTGGVTWLVKWLIQSGEDPVSVISQLSSRISGMGGDVIGTLEQLASGIMSDGLMGFAQKKARQAVKPMEDALQKNSTQGSTIAQLHQTTLTTMQTRLNTLTTQGGGSGMAWQGPSADAMTASFGDISGLLNGLTSPLEGGSAQDTLNQACIRALEVIVVVGGIVLVCELVVTCIVAIAGIETGPGELAIIGGGAALMETTLQALAVLVAADLLVWLVGSIAIYVTDLIHSHPANTQPKGGNIANAHSHQGDLPLNPGQAVPGGRIYIPPKKARGKPFWNGKGYTDDKGNSWEWDKSGHGGPHWDVQHPDGSHTNVAPNGKVIGKDNFPNNDSLKPPEDNNPGSNNGNSGN